MEYDDKDLMPRLREALHEPALVLELSTNLFGGQPIIVLSKPGATSRSKPVSLGVPMLVGDKDLQPHSAMLELLAHVMAEEGR